MYSTISTRSCSFSTNFSKKLQKNIAKWRINVLSHLTMEQREKALELMYMNNPENNNTDILFEYLIETLCNADFKNTKSEHIAYSTGLGDGFWACLDTTQLMLKKNRADRGDK